MSAEGQPAHNSQQMLQMLSQAGVHKDHQEAIRDLISQDFLLSNLDNQDVRYIRLLAENIALYASCQAPPTESGLQSEVAAGLMADPGAADLEPMSPSDKDRIESVMLAFFSRVCRSRGGWQQEKLSEQIVTRRMEKLEDEDESQGRFARLFK